METTTKPPFSIDMDIRLITPSATILGQFIEITADRLFTTDAEKYNAEIIPSWNDSDISVNRFLDRLARNAPARRAEWSKSISTVSGSDLEFQTSAVAMERRNREFINDFPKLFIVCPDGTEIALKDDGRECPNRETDVEYLKLMGVEISQIDINE